MSDADVESYKQIKSDLDVLRQSVEKSELWVYKSNKPAVITTSVANQSHTSDNEQQTMFMTNVQVPVVTQDVAAQMTTSSTYDATTKLQQPISSTDTHSTTMTDKELQSDTSATDGSTEEDEDDEYRKIQKVTMIMVTLFLNI